MYVRFSPRKKNISRLRRDQGIRPSAPPRVSPPTNASTPRTPGGVDGETARRARPGANAFTFFSGYEFVKEPNFGGAPTASPSSKKKSPPMGVENRRGEVPGFCGPRHFAPANSAATLGSHYPGPYQGPAYTKATGAPQLQSRLRIVATHLSWFT